MAAVSPNFFQKPRSRLQRSSRMQQLSSVLPALQISPSKSKLSKDTQRPPLPRKPAPVEHNVLHNRPPTRDAPPAPLPLQNANNEMPPPPKKRLQKSDSPNRLKPLPNPRASSPARTASATTENNPRRNSLLAMVPGTQGRSVSSPVGSRPNSSGTDGSDPASGSKLRRKSFLHGGKSRSRHTSQEVDLHNSGAWVNAGDHKIDYNLSLLTSGEKVDNLYLTSYSMLNSF